jgi:hypothetical protein
MAVPVFDNFNRGNYNGGFNSTDWAGTTTGFAIASSMCSAYSLSGERLAYWNTDTFADDQYAQVKLTALTTNSTQTIGPAVRCTTGGYGYAVAVQANEADIVLMWAGSSSWLAMPSGAWAANDMVRLEVVGSVLTCYRNGIACATVTDTTFPSGKPGLYANNSTASQKVDDFEGGNLYSGTVTDNFNRANGAMGANWGGTTSAFQVLTCILGRLYSCGRPLLSGNSRCYLGQFFRHGSRGPGQWCGWQREWLRMDDDRLDFNRGP